MVFACFFGEFAEFGDLHAKAVFGFHPVTSHSRKLVRSSFGSEFLENFLSCRQVGAPFWALVWVEVLFTVCRCVLWLGWVGEVECAIVIFFFSPLIYTVNNLELVRVILYSSAHVDYSPPYLKRQHGGDQK